MQPEAGCGRVIDVPHNEWIVTLQKQAVTNGLELSSHHVSQI
jgi:hypothetical protein